MASHNLVQELVQEMGPYNPALNAQPGMPMGFSQGPMGFSQGPMPQGQMPMGPQMMSGNQMGPQMMPGGPMGQPMGPQMPNYVDQSFNPGSMIGPQLDPRAHGTSAVHQAQQQEPIYMTEEQMQEMMDLENFGMDGSHRPLSDRAMDHAREAAFLAILFVILSLPTISQALQRTVPQLASNFYYLLGAKGLLLALAFFIAKYFELV